MLFLVRRFLNQTVVYHEFRFPKFEWRNKRVEHLMLVELIVRDNRNAAQRNEQ